MSSHATVDPLYASSVEEGTVLAFEELHYNPAVLDDASDLSTFKAVVLTDSTVVTAALKEKLAIYYRQGGTLVVSYKGGFDENDKWALDFLPVQYKGSLEMTPTYWRTTSDFWADMSDSARVFYEAGLEFEVKENARAVVERVLPYFQRTDITYMSHFQAPPVHESHLYPAVIVGERFVLFADPVFGAYRRSGNVFVREVLERVLYQLIGKPLAGAGLPRTVQIYPRRRGNDLLLTLLHYIPIRKALEGDVLEEAFSFSGEVLAVENAEGLTTYTVEGLELKKTGDGFVLPNVKGRLLVELSGYFTPKRSYV